MPIRLFNVFLILIQYNENTEIKSYLDEILRRLQSRNAVGDIGAMLIKPVQRIMIYPLLLNELAKVAKL